MNTGARTAVLAASIALCPAPLFGETVLTFETIPMPAPLYYMWATGMSADGNTVCGLGQSPLGTQYAVRWTRSGGSSTLITENGFLNCIAKGISADGSTIAGWAARNSQNGQTAVYWKNGAPKLPFPQEQAGANCASADGTYIAGFTGGEAFRWSAAGGLQSLPGVTGFASEAYSISYNGSVVVGSDFAHTGWIWKDGVGTTALGLTPSGHRALPWAVSGDGLVAVGDAEKAGEHIAFSWTEADGFTDLGSLDPVVRYSHAYATNADGSVIVGDSRRADGDDYPFVWTEATGMLDLQSILVSAGLPAADWRFMKPTGISADGLTITGYGTHRGVGTRAWIATIPASSTLALALVPAAFTARRRRLVSRPRSALTSAPGGSWLGE